MINGIWDVFDNLLLVCGGGLLERAVLCWQALPKPPPTHTHTLQPGLRVLHRLGPESLTGKLNGFWHSAAGLISRSQGCVCSQGSINTSRRKEGKKEMRPGIPEGGGLPSKSGNWSGNRGPRLEPRGPRDKVESSSTLRRPGTGLCFVHINAFHLPGNTEADVIILTLRKLRLREVM